MAKFIPYGRQNISDEDINAIVNVLKGDWITQGPSVKGFEDKLTAYTGAKYCSAISSATSGLHLACLALGVGTNDTVWTSPNSFVASSNCALYCGAGIDFVDIDKHTYNMCVSSLEQKLKSAKKLPKVVIPVHFSGQSCDMVRIKELSEEYGFKIIEDASHCIGGSYGDNKIGSCEYSDFCVFSFHPVKIITTGEGGAIMCNNEELANKVAMLRTHGITRDNIESDEPWYYEQQQLGLNYRITDIQCALGSSQMDRLDGFINKRHELADRYDRLLKGLPIKTPVRISGYSALHLYVIQVENRREVFDYLRANNIGVNVHYIPIHTQPYYKDLGFNDGDFPVAEDYYAKAISLPMFPDLTSDEQSYVVQKLQEALSA